MMKLSEFLALTAKEKELENELIEFIRTNPTSDAIREKTLTYSDSLLFKIALNNATIDNFFQSDALVEYWNDLWRRAGLNPKGCKQEHSKPVHEYLPMVTNPSFNLLKGLFIYEEYRRLINRETMSEQLINEAAEYLFLSTAQGCFFAMNALCLNGLKLLPSKFNEELVQCILLSAHRAAELYWTPGYLLLAYVYKELVEYKDEKSLERFDLPLNALHTLSVAQALEELSSSMLNNAYQGKSITEASNGAFKSFFQAKMKLISDLNISPGISTLAARKATLDASVIKSKYQKAITDANEISDTIADMERTIPTF